MDDDLTNQTRQAPSFPSDLSPEFRALWLGEAAWAAADLLPSDVEAPPFTAESLVVRSYFPVFVSYPEGAAPLPAPVVPIPPAAALPDTDDGAGQTAPINPADTVVDILRSQPLSKPDRQRIGRELDSANERADGTKASTGEAFGRIRSGNPTSRLGLTTL